MGRDEARLLLLVALVLIVLAVLARPPADVEPEPRRVPPGCQAFDITPTTTHVQWSMHDGVYTDIVLYAGGEHLELTFYLCDETGSDCGPYVLDQNGDGVLEDVILRDNRKFQRGMRAVGVSLLPYMRAVVTRPPEEEGARLLVCFPERKPQAAREEKG